VDFLIVPALALAVLAIAYLVLRRRQAPRLSPLSQAPPDPEPLHHDLPHAAEALLAAPPMARAPELSPTLERALAERAQMVGERRGQPPSEAMIAAVQQLGVDPAGLDFEQVSTVLAIRDYVLTLAERTHTQETQAELLALIANLVNDPSVHTWITAWSWQTRDHETRRVPRDALRARCEAFLRALRP
jgi:hypothetical protein